MPFGSSQWMYNSGDNFYNGQISQSLRFDGSTSKLTRTPSASGNQKKWTTSFWVKRSELGVPHYLWSGGSYSGNDGIAAIYFSDDKIHTYFDTSGANPYGAVNDRLYRDTSAWYHIVWAVDAVNTVQRIWVNGVEETLNSGLNPPNFDYGMNRAGTNQAFGVAAWGGSPDLNGYLAEIVHLDGQYLDETYFGEFKNGVWIPIEITGLTFGTNGFHLSFADSSSIGDDISVNTNDFTPTGLDSYDVVPDSPENNFATLNALDKGSQVDLAEGNLGVSWSASAGHAVRSTFTISSGKWYAEFMAGASQISIGIAKQNNTGVGVSWLGSTAYGAGGSYAYNNSGTKRTNGSNDSYGATFASGDIIGVAFDSDNGTITFYKNGASQGEAYSGISGEFSFGLGYYGSTLNSTKAIINFGADASFAGAITAGTETPDEGAGVFKYPVPTGFKALCSANLPELTISPNADTQAENYFGVLTWSGDDNASRTIATGGSGVSGSVDFTPDWAWIKRRNGSSNGSDHLLLDIVRGVGSFNGLTSNGSSIEGQTAAGSTWSNFGDISAFATNGFTVQKGSDPSHTLEGINQSGGTYVGWNWKAGGTGASNTNGTISSSVSANTDAGFSIATWSGNSTSGATIGHGLSSAPNLIITKCRSHASSWTVGIGNIAGFSVNDYVSLNSNNGKGSSSTFYQSYTTNSNTTFQVGVSAADEMNKTGRTYVSYCFAEVEGFSLFGKFVGNGLADGSFVYLGFRPAFVIIKDADTAGYNWYLYDNLRKPYNNNSKYLVPNTIGVEQDYVGDSIDHLSNGFKLRTLAGGRGTNRSNINYIYMAFAENPFKYANAR